MRSRRRKTPIDPAEGEGEAPRGRCTFGRCPRRWGRCGRRRRTRRSLEEEEEYTLLKKVFGYAQFKTREKVRLKGLRKWSAFRSNFQSIFLHRCAEIFMSGSLARQQFRFSDNRACTSSLNITWSLFSLSVPGSYKCNSGCCCCISILSGGEADEEEEGAR